MTWETEFEEFLTQEVTREAYSAQNDYAEATFGPPETLKARVVFKPELVRRSGGETSGVVDERVATARVYCLGVPEWTVRDRITMPDGSQPEILQVLTFPDEDGEHHQVVVV